MVTAFYRRTAIPIGMGLGSRRKEWEVYRCKPEERPGGKPGASLSTVSADEAFASLFHLRLEEPCTSLHAVQAKMNPQFKTRHPVLKRWVTDSFPDEFTTYSETLGLCTVPHALLRKSHILKLLTSAIFRV